MAPKTKTQPQSAPRSVEKELLELERQYWQALKDRDVEAALELTDDPCIVAGAQGVATIGRDQFAEMMEKSDWTLHDFRLSDDVQVQRLSDDVAVIGYQVHEDMTVEGKPLSLDAADTSVWVRKEGRWLCAAHTESLIGDPFGRDRAPAPE
jgi:uncharacterized protein (TIGR02246 family)